MKIAAALIVKNEEQSLGRCLASIKAFVDEIVVVDTGSEDNTLAIAREYGAVVGHFKWCDDFAAARNASLDLVTADWVLIIDADEWLEPIDLHEIARETRADACGCRQVWETGGCKVVRFGRMPVRFERRVHEQMVVSSMAPSDIVLRTDGYGDMGGKLQRNRALLTLEVRDRPDESYPRWQLAKTLSQMGDREGGLSLAREALALSKTDLDRNRAYVALLHALSSEPRRCLEACDDAMAAGCGTVLVWFVRGQCLARLGRDTKDFQMEMARTFGIRSDQQFQAALAADLELYG